MNLDDQPHNALVTDLQASPLTPQEKQRKIQQFRASDDGIRKTEETVKPKIDDDDGEAPVSKQEEYNIVLESAPLTMDEKHKQFKEIMKSPRNSGSSQARSSKDKLESTPSVQPPLVYKDSDEVPGIPCATKVPESPVPAPCEEGPSKEELAQEVMKDPTLTPHEKQEKRRKILGSPHPSPYSIASPRLNRGVSLAAGVDDRHQVALESARQVLNHPSFTLQEKQEKVREIMARASRPSPLQSNFYLRRCLQLQPFPKTTRKTGRRLRTASSPPLPGAFAVSPGTPDSSGKIFRGGRLANKISKKSIGVGIPPPPPIFEEGQNQSPSPSGSIPDALRQSLIHSIMDDDHLTNEEKEKQVGDIFGVDLSGHTMATQSTEAEIHVAAETEGVLAEDEEASEIQAYVTSLRVKRIKASDLTDERMNSAGVLTEEEIAEEDEKMRFYMGLVCCFCLLLLVIVVPLGILTRDNDDSIAVVKTPTEAPTLFPTQPPSIAPTPSSVVELLLELEWLYPNYDEFQAVFNITDTPQYKALFWATGEGNPRGLSGVDPQLISRYALATFYFSTIGDEWVRCSRDGANCDPGEEWLSADDECDWFGITCEDGQNGRSEVTQIFFPPTGQAGENNIAGTLPFELGLLTSLKRITISRNNIGGSIPSSWADLTTLEAVILSDNQLTGELPASLINNNQGLRQLRLSGNEISKLPQDPVRSAGLTILDLQNNALEGSIPDGIRGLSVLQTLDLRGNNLNGGIPDSLFQITTLRDLYLADNSLFGRISTSFGALADIRRVELTGNNFIGRVPEALCGLKSDSGGSLEFLTADCNKVVCDCCDNDCMREFPNPSDTGV